jgi:F-box interacting protein
MTADDANAAATACVPREVLASVFLRLPASDLRRFRRVCKEWREVISDPVFVNEHLEHGPWALTHTIVFVRGRIGADQDSPEPLNGQGLLFDEQWRLVATFTAGASEDLVGTCNGLMCFLDVHQGAINVVEPFTGERLALPLPPETEKQDERGAYCFGFDSRSRRYKIFHQGLFWQTDDTAEQDMYVYTIGGGESWRSVQVAGAAAEPGVPLHNKDPVFADGTFYSYAVAETADRLAQLACFDLATEETTSEPITDFVQADDEQTLIFLMTDSDARVCVMTVGGFGKWDLFFKGEGGRLTQNSRSGVELSEGQNLALPQALQRGHLLIEDRWEGVMHVHPVPSAMDNKLGPGKLLLKIGSKEEDEVPAKVGSKEEDQEPAKISRPGLFVPAMLDHEPEIVEPVPHQWRNTGVATFCYALPLLPAPLARRCGLACGSPQTLAENKVTSRS